MRDHSLRLLEQFLQSVIPLKRCVGLEQGAERRHSLGHAECVCYLVDQAEPTSNISYVLRCREAPDCTEVLLAGPNAVTCYLKSSEFNSVCSEYELLWVEGNSASAHKSSHLVAWWKLASRSIAHKRVSSMHLVLSGKSEAISSKRRE